MAMGAGGGGGGGGGGGASEVGATFCGRIGGMVGGGPVLVLRVAVTPIESLSLSGAA
jgi:hypothetical protein